MAAATLAAALLVLALPGTRAFVLTAAEHLAAGDLAALRDWLRTFGGGAWLVSAALMILQSLAAPIPAVPITLVNGLIYGPWLGALLSWGSAQLAAMLCFWIARALGRPFVEGLFAARALQRFDGFFAAHGWLAILTARLVPIVSFDLISYAAGVTRMRALPFFVATGLGQLPATIVYSHAGAASATNPSGAVKLVLWFLAAVVVAGGAVWLSRRRVRDEPTPHADLPPRGGDTGS